MSRLLGPAPMVNREIENCESVQENVKIGFSALFQVCFLSHIAYSRGLSGYKTVQVPRIPVTYLQNRAP